MKISCVSYSYIAEPLGYPGDIDWDSASEASIKAPLLESIDNMLNRLAPARLDGLEIWYNHVWPANITPILAGEIRKRLAAHGMVCCACAGSAGNPRKDIYASEARFQTAYLLHAPLIAGHLASEAAADLGRLGAEYRIRVAYENYLEKDAGEILNVIRGGGEWVGLAFDTGSFAEQGGDPVQAIREIGDKLMHVHLRDVPEVGSLKSVPVGTGMVDLSAVIHELQKVGYEGWLSIEVPVEDHDPTEDILASAEKIRSLLNK